MLAFLIPVVAGIFVGFINGFLVSKLHFPAMIATFAMQLMLRGIVHVLTGNATYRPGVENPALRTLASGNLFGVLPVASILMVIIFITMNYLLKYQPLIRNIYAVGGNMEAASMMGINPQRTLMIAHMLCGITAGLAGIVMGARTGGAVPLGGDGYEMLAIASVVIGGTYLSGGRGKLSGTFIGVFIVGILSNIFKMQDVLSSHWERVFIGSLLLLVLLTQTITNKSIPTKLRRKTNVVNATKEH